tara:strand:+ start:314 stop:943 length:630 start_codon:yes stop_codon:yes gene_type:complete
MSLELGSQNSNLVKSQVGMDWVIGLIDSNFSTVITFVTVLFSFFAVLTFLGVKETFNFSISSLNKRMDDQMTEWNVHKNYIKNVEGDLSFEMGKSINKDLVVLYDKSDKDINDYKKIVEFSLVTCDYLSKSLLLKSDIHPNFEKSVKSLIKSVLSDTYKLISTQDKFELDIMNYNRFLSLQRNIEQVVDLKDKQNLSSIFSKLDFPSLS